eukprot:3088305-Alexandrium_andersonii.AAC.1
MRSTSLASASLHSSSAISWSKYSRRSTERARSSASEAASLRPLRYSSSDLGDLSRQFPSESMS